MSIRYSDGTEVETRIQKILSQSSDLSADCSVFHQGYDEWAVKYHLCAERANLVRHLDFSGLSVLELGAGMGAVSRYLAEHAQSLTVVEGTQSRFDALSARLRDLSNWKGSVSNIQDFQTSERFDVVCVIGVLEYSELYIRTTETSALAPFQAFLNHARSFLKPGGVLVLAIENRLGIKYWGGAAEDHTGRVFDGIVDYPQYPETKGPRTFSRQELLGLLTSTGFASVEEYYPFPDYKIPSCVLSRKATQAAPELASEIAGAQGYESYTRPRYHLFSDRLALNSMGKAGLFEEFSNSFLFLATSNLDSPVLAHLMKNQKVNSEIAWHYSMNRRHPTRTAFKLDKSVDSKVWVEKRKINVGKNQTPDQSPCHWSELPSAPVCAESKLSFVLARFLYFGNRDAFIRTLVDFLRQSLERFRYAEDPTRIKAEALDAVFSNATASGELFDQEWTAPAPMTSSWFVLRNVLRLADQFELFSPALGFGNFLGLYEFLCQSLSVTPSLEQDMELEAKFQQAVTLERPLEYHRAALAQILSVPFYHHPMPHETSLETDWRELMHLRDKFRYPQYRAATAAVRLFQKIPVAESMVRWVSRQTRQKLLK